MDAGDLAVRQELVAETMRVQRMIRRPNGGGPKRSARLLLSAAFVFAAIGSVPAHAESAQCHGSGQTEGVQVFELSQPIGGSDQLILGIKGGLPNTPDGKNYYDGTEGVEIINAATLQPVAFYFLGLAGQRMRARISSSDQTIIDAEAPSYGGAMGWYQAAVPAGLDPGTYYVLTFGIGNHPYDAFAQTNGFGVTCKPVSLSSATLIQLDQTEFSTASGSQVDLIAAGIANNLKASRQITASLVGGYAGAGSYHGTGTMKYVTPTNSGSVKGGYTVPIGSSGGRFDFTASYSGVLPRIRVAVWAVTFA